MEEVTAQQCGKGEGKVLEPPECNQCMECGIEYELRPGKSTSCIEHGIECELGPGKSTLCTECREAKAKCKRSGEEKPERKCKWADVEEPEAEPSSSKRPKKTLEERSDGVAELVEVLGAGLKAITDALSKQGKLLQELVELEVDKVELMQLDQWVSEDEEEEETEEGEEVEVEQELLELAKEREENGDASEEEVEAEE